MTIAVNFSNSAHAQMSKQPNSVEVSIDYKKIISNAVQSSINGTKSFPIMINYPDKELLLKAGYTIWEKISYDPAQQALILDGTQPDHKKTQKILKVHIAAPFTADVVLLGKDLWNMKIDRAIINDISYDAENDGFIMNITWYRPGKLIAEINKDCKLKKFRIYDATKKIIDPMATWVNILQFEWKTWRSIEFRTSEEGDHTTQVAIIPWPQ